MEPPSSPLDSDASEKLWSPESSHINVSSPDAEPEFVEDEQPVRVVRKVVDDDLVTFLIDYAARSPECPRLLKAYLENVVLQPGPDEELRARVSYYLRNPETNDFGAGPDFKAKIAQYKVHGLWFTHEGRPHPLPYPPIPEEYRPKRKNARALAAAIELDEATTKQETQPEDEEDIEEGNIDVENENDEDFANRILERLKAAGHNDRRSRSRSRTSQGPSRRSRLLARSKASTRASSTLRDPDALPDLLDKLDSIPTPPPSNIGQGDAQPMEPRIGPEWTIESWYKGTTQPPLALRLESIINFLGEEDVDRCIAWNPGFPDIVTYLEWLTHDDPDHQLANAGPKTHALYDEAVSMARAHVLFERHHYEPTPLEIEKPTNLPLKSTRLSWAVNLKSIPNSRDQLLPYPLCPRGTAPVSLFPVDETYGKKFLRAFVKDQEAYWTTDKVDKTNLTIIEAQAFDKFSRPDILGGVRQDKNGQSILPDGTPIKPGSATAWARERGARRIALQQAIRYLGALDCSAPGKKHQVVLPLDAATLRRARKAATDPLWKPAALNWDQVPRPQRLDPQGFTFNYPIHAAEQRALNDLALRRAKQQHGRSKHWITLPRNVVNGGPFVWRMLKPELQENQDLLDECVVTVKVLTTALARTPRALLETVDDMVKRGLEGEFGSHIPPEGVDLVDDEWEMIITNSGKEMRCPRMVSHGDLQWLKFLASESVNEGTWTGRFRPDVPPDKHKLFLIFTKRVQRVLDDRDPQGLFSGANNSVTVENLLLKLNAGTDTTAVDRVEFTPFEACAFLDRMRRSGHVRFRENRACYGVIERPLYNYHPENRVLMPGDNNLRPIFPTDIADWKPVVCGDYKPTDRQSSRVWSFYTALAYRLGYSIDMLRQFQAETPSPKPRPTRYLTESLQRYETECEAVRADPWLPMRPLFNLCFDHDADRSHYKDTMTTDDLLAIVRTRVIDEISANESMLFPSRRIFYFNKAGERSAADVRDVNWDWASPKVRNTVKRFWSLSRWPLTPAGHISSDEARAVTQDMDLDLAQTYDPTKLDPIDDKWCRPKLKRYGEEEPTKNRYGPPVFPVGDTARQRRVIEEYMTTMAHRALNLPNTPSWANRLSQYLPPSLSTSLLRLWGYRPGIGSTNTRGGSTQGLPGGNLRYVPESWDLEAERERWERSERERLEREEREQRRLERRQRQRDLGGVVLGEEEEEYEDDGDVLMEGGFTFGGDGYDGDTPMLGV